jgi:hypothetical protein
MLEGTVGEAFDLDISNSLGDAEQHRLRYHLLRLTVVGLAHDEVAELTDLGRACFKDQDAGKSAAAILARTDATPLARAIADIVQRTETGTPGHDKLRDVFLGAVLGAYVGLSGVTGSDKETAAVIGATAGAVAVPTQAFISEQIQAADLDSYLQVQG